jgi:hypothetical protein
MTSAIVAPYITAWSEEHAQPYTLIERLHGIGYADETIGDRDSHGVLWARTPLRPRQGRPEFQRVHPQRQRRAMQRLLCQVCAGPADCNEDGVLWVLKDHRDDWPSWPNRMGVTEPPVCAPCARIASNLCPALRRGAAVIRVGSCPVIGVRGMLYRRGGGTPVAVGPTTVSFGDPMASWVRAANLIRELGDCTLISFEELP